MLLCKGQLGIVFLIVFQENISQVRWSLKKKILSTTLEEDMGSEEREKNSGFFTAKDLGKQNEIL